MLTRTLHAFLALALLSCQLDAKKPGHLYLCRSPILAFDFWESVQKLQRQGITITPTITDQVCKGMKAGDAPQCIRVEGEEFKPVASGWGGALAMSDGRTKMWFHEPDSGGWIHPDYYVSYINPEGK